MRSILPSSVDRVLRVVVRIVAAAAVAQADVEIAVGTEGEIAAVVIRERLPMNRSPVGQRKVEARRRIDLEGRRGRPHEARDHRVAVRVREVEEHAAAEHIGRKRHAEQPALAAG